MTVHTHASGIATLLGSGGHGKAAAADYDFMPATIVTDDDDGHYDAWKVTGKMKDAAEKIAPFYLREGKVVEYHSGRLTVINTPDDFWVGVGTQHEDGSFDDYSANLRDYPNVIAF